MIFNSLSRQNSLNYNYVKIGSLSAHDNSITMMLELNDNKLVTASLDKTIKIWEFKKDNFENKQILKSHKEGVYTLILLYDGRLVSGGNDNIIIVWKKDLNKFSVMQKFTHNET
jgi:WD40 repeat protein